MALGEYDVKFEYRIFKGILVIDILVVSCEITLKWMEQDPTDGRSTLV